MGTEAVPVTSWEERKVETFWQLTIRKLVHEVYLMESDYIWQF